MAGNEGKVPNFFFWKIGELYSIQMTTCFFMWKSFEQSAGLIINCRQDVSIKLTDT